MIQRLVMLPVLLLVPIAAQESTRNLERPGEQFKHLTTDTVDRWLFEAAVDDVFRSEVSSAEFDPVISLVQLDGSGKVSEVVVPDVDEPGSSSNLLARIQRAGRYALLVHGPDNRGGGNYRLHVERFRSIAPAAGQAFTDGILDRDGLAHVRFEARAGESIVPTGAGVTEVLDPLGRSLDHWAGCFDIRKGGEHHLRVRGSAGSQFRVGVERARDGKLVTADAVETEIGGQGLDQWIVDGTIGAFRTLEVAGDRLDVRVTTVAGEIVEPIALERRPELTWLPSHSKGVMRRFALVFGRDRAFRVQVHCTAPDASRYTISFGDPSIALEPGKAAERRLPVGGAEFFTYRVRPGQLLRLECHSTAFDPLLRLTASDGTAVGENDDGGGNLSSRFEWLVRSADLQRFQVTSVGDGGGGDYRLTLTELPVPDLAIGVASRGDTGAGTAAYWHLRGKKDQTLFVSARSVAADVAVALFDPDGVEIGRDEDSGADRDALFGVKLARAGEYTLVVTSRGGRGEYVVQAMDPDSSR